MQLQMAMEQVDLSDYCVFAIYGISAVNQQAADPESIAMTTTSGGRSVSVDQFEQLVPPPGDQRLTCVVNIDVIKMSETKCRASERSIKINK